MTLRLFSNRFPFSRSSTDAQPAVAAPRPRSAIYGDNGVQYNDDGRLQYPGQESNRPSNMLLWRDTNNPTPPDNEPTTNWRYRPWTVRRVQGDQVYAAPPMITRRFDTQVELPYVAPSGGVMTSEVSRRVTTTMTPETVVVEEMKIYDTKPCAWWFYILIGVLMLILGILNLLWCVEHHYFGRFWTGVALILFGITGAVHRGDYVEHTIKTWIFIILGIIATGMCLALANFVTLTVTYQTIEITQYNPQPYVNILQLRYNLTNQQPAMILQPNPLSTNIWTCFALDCFELLLIYICCFVWTSTLIVIDRFYNSHVVITRKVEPFCEPWLFNPWGQSSLGQAQILIGYVLIGSVFGNQQTDWQTTYAPVWSGAVPMVAGVAAALCLKSPNAKGRWFWNLLTIILEIGVIAVCIAAIVLMSYGLVDNIKTLNQAMYSTQTNSMTITTFGRNMMVASVLLFGAADIAAIVNVFYALSLLIRLLYSVCTSCCGNKDEEQEETKYLDDGKDVKPTEKTTNVTYVKDKTEYPYYGFDEYRPSGPSGTPYDAYRPPGGRSYYVR